MFLDFQLDYIRTPQLSRSVCIMRTGGRFLKNRMDVSPNLFLRSRAPRKVAEREGGRGWKIHVAKYSLLGFTCANERNNITIEPRGRTRCDEFNYRFPEGENIFLECNVSIFETRRNQRRVAVYFGESSMEYYYRSRQRFFR